MEAFPIEIRIYGAFEARPPPSSTSFANPRPMATTVWHIDQLDHPFIAALIDRGIPAGHRFTMSQADYETGVVRYEQLLSAFPNGLLPPKAATRVEVTLTTRWRSAAKHEGTNLHLQVVGPNEHVRTFPDGSGTVTVAVHHLLSGRPSTPYAATLKAWKHGTEQHDDPGDLGIEGGYWVTLHDAVRAVLHIAGSIQPGHETVHICGRRWWSATDTWQELAMLSSRNAAGLYGIFTTDHLSNGASVPIGVTDVSNPTSLPPDRPDLGPLHRLLNESTGEGWRPNTPLRQGLMQALADMVDHEH